MRRILLFLLAFLLAPGLAAPVPGFAATTTTHKSTHQQQAHQQKAKHRAQKRVVKKHSAMRKRTARRGVVRGHVVGKRSSAAARRHVVRAHVVRRARYRRRYYERFTAKSFATRDLTAGDVTGGEDPLVRQAAIDALGRMNGTVVAIDPSDGRILAMVNQKLALSGGAEPCSTIKISVALAALEEGIITRDKRVQLGRHYAVNLTEALAHSNNLYFETVGRRLGFRRLHQYEKEFGLGELAGWNIRGEQPGVYPDRAIPERKGGVGRMCSFGEGVAMTPLQLGALVAAVANGGTLYYLQHPTKPEELLNFRPRVKRRLNIARILPELQPGMEAVVRYGTARSLRENFRAFPVMGKTGTCSDEGTRFGWFASYADTRYGRVATVVFLEGGRPTFGPKAAELTGIFYRDLYQGSYFGAEAPQEAMSPANSATAAAQP